VCLVTVQRTANFSRQEFSLTSFKTLNENGRNAAAEIGYKQKITTRAVRFSSKCVCTGQVYANRRIIYIFTPNYW